jgi:hypothetical protein
MTSERVPEGCRGSVVKEYLHVSPFGCSRHQAFFSVAQDELHLFTRYARKPFQEFIDARAAFQIFKQCTHRDARMLEKPFAATLTGYALNGRTLRPIKHAVILGWRKDHDKVGTLCLRS